MIDIEKERSAFEILRQSRFAEDRLGDGYRNSLLQREWETWLAAKHHAAQVLHAEIMGDGPAAPSGAGVDSPAPCPHCGAAMDGDAEFMSHPKNDCILSEWEFSQPDIAKWNRRASVDSDARPKVYVTCIGKGGKYQHLGVAMGAGTKRGSEDLDVYGDTKSGELYYRSRSDFRDRMVPFDAAMSPTKAEEGKNV